MCRTLLHKGKFQMNVKAKSFLSVLLLTLLTVTLASCTQKVNFYFDSNGGSSVESIKTDGKSILWPDAPTKDGFSFAGWYYDNDTFENAFPVNMFHSSMFLNDTTLYAKWEVINYTISYQLNGGELVDNPTVYNIETTTFSLLDPYKAGQTFAGWYDNEGFSGSKVISIQKGTYEDLILYAKWIAN